MKLAICQTASLVCVSNLCTAR